MTIKKIKRNAIEIFVNRLLETILMTFYMILPMNFLVSQKLDSLNVFSIDFL